MAHSPAAYRRLGRIVAAAGTAPRDELRRRYRSELMAALAVPASRGRHANVLAHMLGHMSRALSAEHRREMHALIDDYARAVAPLLAPLSLLRHHAARLGVSYLLGQVYLDPYPKDLMLRR